MTTTEEKKMADLSIDVVAKAAGVHRSTVSRAFSRPEAVKSETREHILRVAEGLGYTMSPLAQALRRKTSTFVPLIVPDITNPFFAELAKTMTQAADERGYQLLLCVTNGDPAKTDGYFTAMQAMYAPFGIVAPSTKVDTEALKRFDFGHKVVVIDRVEGDSSVPTVTVDSRRGIMLALEHLRSLGHTSIGYVSGIAGTHTAQDRMDAYLELSSEGNGTPLVLDSGSDPDAGARAAKHYLEMENPPTAIIAANDMVAFAVISALGQSGVRVPEDVSVMGFDGLALGARFNPPLTTVRQPIADMGNIAIELAEKQNLNGSVDHIVLEPELLVRASTSGPRK
jgi:DNA-binding LacI/PurR family transcriptional regulator